MSLNLDKSTWATVRFGDVVRNVNETVRDASATGIDRVIALEHLDGGALEVARWGDDPSATTFTKRARPGQTLFGKRRAYQRKAAYAEFDAITSGDILVFEPASDRLSGPSIVAELLPFLVQSEPFFKHALGTSAGSLSPRTNWGDLAKLEFALPSLDEQRRLADLLWSTEHHVRMLRQRARDAELVRDSLNAATFSAWLAASALPLEDLFAFQIGKRLSPEGRARGGEQLPYVTNSNVYWRRLDLSEVREMPFLPREVPIYELQAGDVLACEARFVGRACVWNGEVPDAKYQMSLHRLRKRAGYLEPEALVEYFHWCSVSGRFKAIVGDNLIPHLPEVRFRKFQAPNPTRFQAEAYGRQLRGMAAAIEAAESELSHAGTVASSLTQEVFG